MTHGVARRGTLVALSAAAAAVAQPLRAQGQRPLELGVVPHLSARTLLGLYRPVREFLQQQLHQALQLSTAPTWDAFHRRTLALDFDCVVTAANLARLAQVDAGWVPLATCTPPIRGLLVGARLRPLSPLVDWRGARLALGNAQSLVALRGLQWLAEQGLQQGVHYQTVAVPQDDSAGALVARGDCAAALLSGGELLALPDDTRAQLMTTLHFADVPAFVMAASPRLAPAQQALLRQAWLDLGAGSDEGRAYFAASGFGGIEPALPALMASLDPLLPQTRRLFAPGP